MKIKVFYFSGTGNTEYMVKLLAEEFRTAGNETDLVRIEDIRKGNAPLSLEGYGMIGIAHPILGFDCPAMIYEFARSLPEGTGLSVFLLKTGADYHGVNNGSSKSMIKLLKKKGFDPFYDDIVAMPSNWLIAYDDRMARQLVEWAGVKVRKSAAAILAGERKMLRINFFFRWLMKGIGTLEDRYGSKYFGSYLKTSDACTLCGLCVRNCPAGNIENSGGKISFGKKCVWCMRCIYHCPKGSIDNKYMNFFILKNGYSLKKIREFSLDAIDFNAKKIPFMHRYFRKYARQIGVIPEK